MRTASSHSNRSNEVEISEGTPLALARFLSVHARRFTARWRPLLLQGLGLSSLGGRRQQQNPCRNTKIVDARVRKLRDTSAVRAL